MIDLQPRRLDADEEVPRCDVKGLPLHPHNLLLALLPIEGCRLQQLVYYYHDRRTHHLGHYHLNEVCFFLIKFALQGVV